MIFSSETLSAASGANSVNSSSLLLSSAECQADRESNDKTQTAWIEAGEVQSRLEDLNEQL
jgi:hypothetical protein